MALFTLDMLCMIELKNVINAYPPHLKWGYREKRYKKSNLYIKKRGYKEKISIFVGEGCQNIKKTIYENASI